MSVIPQEYLDKLDQAGLVLLSYPPTHKAYPGGVMVGKPEAVRGNCIPGISAGMHVRGEVIQTDAPMLVFVNYEGDWLVTNEFAGAGVFENHWKSGDEAVADILDYYFGDASRMNVTAEYENEIRKRSQDLRNQARVSEQKAPYSAET